MDAQIQRYIGGAASRARETEKVGPFLATFSPDNDNPFLNYAIPDEGATPSPDEVDALVDAFSRRKLTPRLEYLPGLAPAVETALVTRGFVVEARLPIMVCPPGDLQDLPVPECIELLAPISDEDVMATLVAQNEAYSAPPPDVAQLERQRAFLKAGGMAVLARDTATEKPAGGGICDVPANGTTELAAIGVREPFRRRGIAGAMTVRLVHNAFATGVTTVFLMAYEAEAGIYRRAGFSTISEILHISLTGRQG